LIKQEGQHMRFIQSQTSFRSGQLSRKLDGRIDIEEYKHGCRELTDMFSMKTGGVRKAPGDVALEEELVDYSFLYTETFMFSDGAAVRFRFTSVDVVAPFSISLDIYFAESTTSILTVPTGIILNDKEEKLSLTQYEDTVWVATSSGTQYIRGYTWDTATFLIDSTFSNSDNPYNWPLQLENNLSVTLSGPVGSPGSRTGTLSAGNWSDYVGVGELVALVGVSTPNGTNKDIVANYYKVISAVGGVAVLDAYFRITTGVDDALDNGTYAEVYFQAWSSVKGHPRILSSDDGRLIAASTPTKPATLYGSLVNDPRHFNNVRQPFPFVDSTSYYGEILNTDPYIFTIASQRAANIKFIDSNRAMIVGTDEKLYVASGGDGIVGPLNIQIKPFHAKPSSELYVPVNDGVLYLTLDKKRLIMFDYNTDNGTFVSQ